MSFETSFEHLLKWEGGYGNNPHDAGGATNLGVIQEEYDRYRDRKELSRQSVRYISKNEAEEIYKTEYWDATRCGELNAGVANCLFDADVNSGDSRGVQWLQEAANAIYGKAAVAVDKKCGPETVRAANGLSPPQLIDSMLNLRLAFMHVARNSKTGEALWPTFGHGWQSRINGVRAESHALCGVGAPQSPLISAPPHAAPVTLEKPVSDLSPILNLAKVIAPAVAAALEQSHPLFGVAVGALSAALQTSSDSLPAAAATADPGRLAVAIQSAAAAIQTAAAPPVIPGSALTSSAFLDDWATTGKYVIGVLSTALMIRMGFNIDVANGIVANVGPVIWTLAAGLVTTVTGGLLHRSVVGSNAATVQLVKKS
jgi:lysozyme family protein